MKKNIKVTAYILMILMISALITIGIYASFNDVTEYQEAVETLNSIGVITGRTAAQFSPDENVTRWQMALLMTKFLTGNIENSYWASSADAIMFSDVVNNIRHYGGSIAYAVKQNIIIGRSDTVFAPDAGITLQDAVTIMVRALGYPRSQYDAGYPDTYIEKANSLGLFDGLENVYPTDVLTRGETAQLLFNAFTAPKRIGNTIAEDVFEYSDAVIVLTATEDMRISSRVTLATAGKLVFCELKPDGTVDTTSKVSLPASDFDFEDANECLGKSFRVTSVLNYGNILSISECESEILTQNTISNLLSVFSSTGNYIKLDNVTYEVVSKYSYDLEENVTPQSKQMIIYGAGETYETSSVLSASDIYGTNAYYTMTTYDDNGDGYPDRALYRPYSFALYTKTGSDIKLEGAVTHNLKSNVVTMTGSAVTSGNYVIYSYIPDTSALDILKVIPVTTGTVISYTADNIELKANTSNTSTMYIMGNNLLPGAYVSTVKQKFNVNPTASFIGNIVRYAVDGPKVLMLDISDQQGNNIQNSYISRQNCAVVKTVDNSTVLNGYLTLIVYYMDGTANPMYVKVINGNPVNAASMNSVAVGDIIEYAIFQQGYYSIFNITSKPYVSTGDSNSNLYYLGTDLLNIGLGYKNSSSQAIITYYGTVLKSSDMKVIFYNGYAFEDITAGILNNPNYLQQILPNYSMYASYGITDTNAKFIYIRQKYIAPANTPDTSEYTRLLYIGSYSIANRNPLNGVVYYPNAFDFIKGTYVTAEYLIGTYGSIPQAQGYYKASINLYDANRYMLKEPTPISDDIFNANILFDGNTTLKNLSKTSSTYTMLLGDKTYTTTELNIYKFNNEGVIVAAEISNYYINQTTFVDVFMTPANTLNNSARIALLIK